MNITLVGMPRAGKSFIGVRLAKALSFSLIDPDKIMEMAHAKSLQDVLMSMGEERFLSAEADVSAIIMKNARNVVLATGGSIVYSQGPMEALRRHSMIVYLEADLETIQDRIRGSPRGIVGLGDRTFKELYHERVLLYEKWAHVSVDSTQSAKKVVADILTALKLPTA